MRRAPSALAIFALALCASGCSRKAPDAAPSPASSSSAPEAASGAVVLDAIAGLDRCVLGHHGVLLDFGDASMRGRYGAALDTPDPESIEHEGATWTRATAMDRKLEASFFWSEEIPARPERADAGPNADSGAYVEARILGGSARSVSFYLNGKIVGSASLSRGETKVVSVHGGPGPVLAGGNELMMRFNGGSRDQEELAEVDWVHVGLGDRPQDAYAAPTRGDALGDVKVGGVSKRALSIRAPGFVRCEAWLPPDARVESSLALQGTGEADVEVRLLRDRAAPVVLGNAHVSAGSSGPTGWTKVTMPVTDIDPAGPGTLGAVELSVIRATKGTRVAFGEPRVTVPRRATPPPPGVVSHGVVLVVYGGLLTKSLAIYGGDHATPELALLGSEGIVFDAHRASSPVASGAMASMLTGLGAHAHQVADYDARLPHQLVTIADVVRRAGVSTALFTANPTTGPAFGFDRGWDTYVAHAPNDETPAVQVFDEAAKWIEAHKTASFLVVVHARGGHPPWDIAAEELKNLPPLDYVGTFDPKRGAEILTKDKRFTVRFTAADRERVWALYGHALDAHDAALAALVGAVREAGRDADTTIIVTGDAGVNDAAQVPFVDGDALDEPVLSVPLLIRPPLAAHLSGRRVSVPTASEDVARTVLAAMALDPPPSFAGTDLIGLAATGGEGVGVRPMLAATLGRFSLRWGPFVLLGARDHETRMCDLSIEPACATDVRKAYPLALDAMHMVARDTLTPSGARRADLVGREPAFIDPTTMAALVSWGRPQEKKKRKDDE